MKQLMSNLEVLKQPFDIETHKREFVNYLEVIILEDGTIEYAVPSHQEKLIKICCERLNVDRRELFDLCPGEYYLDFNRWLCQVSYCVAVWNDFHIGECNIAQRKALELLKEHKLYRGKIVGGE